MRFSQTVFREIRPDFLKILAVKSTPLLIDVAAALEDALRFQPQGLDRDDAVAIAEGLIESLPGNIPADDGDDITPALLTSRERARLIIDRLCAAGWLERIEQSNFQALIVLQAPAILMLKTLRDIAATDDAVFSDKISGVCATLTDRAIMQNEPWAAVLRSIAQAEEGLAELRGMGSSLERHTRRQLEAATLRENLHEMFDSFTAGASGRCYSELIRARLHTRLTPARRALEDLHFNDMALAMMSAELLRRESSKTPPEAAMSVVREKIDYLTSLLATVVPLTERIDQRIAEFVRRSYARFRYLQESGIDRRGKVKMFFECLNRLGTGVRTSDLEPRLPIPVPSLLLAEIRVIEARSLARARRTLPAAEIEPVGAELDSDSSKECLDDFAKQLRAALTIARANRFAAKLPGDKGSRHRISQITFETEEDVADLIACVLHANSRQARYGIEIARIVEDADELTWIQVYQEVKVENLAIVKGTPK